MSVDRRPALGLKSAATSASDHQGGTEGESGADPFDLDAEALRVLSDEIARDVAPELRRTALVLYDLDPTHLQAQWFVAPEDLAYALGAFPGEPETLRQVLRLCRLYRDGRSQLVEGSNQGVGTAPSQGRKGFTLAGEGDSYECELGLESGDGGWLLLVRSNRIEMTVPAVSPPGGAALAGETLARDSIRIVSEDIHEVSVEMALAAIGEPLDPVFPNTGPVIEPPAWWRTKVPDREEAVARASSALPDWITDSSPENSGAATDPVAQASEGMPPPLLPSDQGFGTRAGEMPGPLYDPRAALSSAALRGREPQGNDLDVRAELIVQGKGRPGARVELFGLPVRIETDGHFHVRRSVDAALVLSLALGRVAAPEPGDPNAE